MTVLDDLYSTKDAAGYLGWPLNQMKLNAFYDHRPKYIEPIGFGEQKRWLFTERMLNEARNGRFPVRPTEEEKTAVLGVFEALELLQELGSPETKNNLKYHAGKGNLPCRVVASRRVFLRRDIVEFAARERRWVSDETRGEISGLAGDGLGYADIGRRVGLPRQTVREVVLDEAIQKENR